MHVHDRRSFFRTAVGAAAFGLPAFLATFRDRPGRRRAAPGGDRQDPQDPAAPPEPTRVQQLAEATARSRKEGRPLLVFVVPDQQDAVWHRSLWFGAFLNNASPAALLEVALCVPACATVGEVRAHTGQVAIPDDPFLLLVDFAGEDPAAVTAVRPELDPIPDMMRGMDGQVPYKDLVAEENRVFEAGLETLTKELHRAMHVAGHTVASLARRARTHLDDEQRRLLDGWLAGGPPPADDLLVRATAIVRDAAAELEDTRRSETIDVLLGAIDRVLIHQRIAGSKWANSSGCGVEIEQPDVPGDRLMIACGMAHMPAMATRFLSFLNNG